jgi:hypothetical protein
VALGTGRCVAITTSLVLTRPISVSVDVDVGGLVLGTVEAADPGSGAVCARATADARTSTAAMLIRGKNGRS